MQPLEPRFSGRVHTLVKNFAKESELMEAISFYWNVGTEDTRNLVSWKAEVDESLIQINEEYFLL